MTPEKMAEAFHEVYERLAPAFGWKTKKGCNVPFAELPQRNKALMIATCQTVLKSIQDEIPFKKCRGCGYLRKPSEKAYCIRGEGDKFCVLGQS